MAKRRGQKKKHKPNRAEINKAVEYYLANGGKIEIIDRLPEFEIGRLSSCETDKFLMGE